MTSSAFRTEVDERGAWACRHVEPGPVTELNVAQLVDGRLRCPDCGTEWCAWPEQRLAAASIDWSPKHHKARFQRAPRVDVDELVERVRERVPLVTIRQLRSTWDLHDRWFFHGHATVVQLDASKNGSRPFTITSVLGAQHPAVDVDAATELLVSLMPPV